MRLFRRACGGRITHRPPDDSIAARLSPGEVWIPRATYERFGPDLFKRFVSEDVVIHIIDEEAP